MSVHDDPQLSKDIWAGKYWGRGGALARHKAEYDASLRQSGDVVAYMSTLYGALTRVLPSARRGNLLSFARALWCIERLAPLVSYCESALKSAALVQTLSAEQCDVISTVLMHWSEIPLYGGTRWLAIASELARTGLERSAKAGHTRPLLLLTLASVSAKMGHLAEASTYLAGAEKLAPQITYSNQRARVYRRIAELVILIRGNGKAEREAARRALVQADTTGIGDDVRAKNAEVRSTLGL